MYSDRSLKENIQPINNTKGLLDLKPVEFTMKGGTRTQYGFIAQDIEASPYDFLVYKNQSGIRSVAYNQIIPLLTAHIIDLTKRIEALESKTNARNL